MALYYVTSDPRAISNRVINVPVAGVSVRTMARAFSEAVGWEVTDLVEKRGAGFKFYEGVLSFGSRIRVVFVPAAMVNDVLFKAGVVSWPR